MELEKLILHRGSDQVVGEKWKNLEEGVAWAEKNLGLVGLGLGYAMKENDFDVSEAIRHLKMGIGGIELDVQGSRAGGGGVPVVSHPRVLRAIVGLGGRGNDQSQRLVEVVERISPIIGDANLFIHLKTKDVGILEKMLDILCVGDLLPKVFFQTYYISHLRQINEILSGQKTKFVYIGWPTNNVIELMCGSKDHRSRLGIPATLAKYKPMLGYLTQKYPEVGLHVNLTYDKDLIYAVANGALAVDSVTVASYI